MSDLVDPQQGIYDLMRIKEMDDAAEALLFRRRQAVASAKIENKDKEPFDVDAFSKLYSLRGDSGNTNITPELIESLEAEYYLDNPDVKSMEDFARRKNDFDKDLD